MGRVITEIGMLPIVPIATTMPAVIDKINNLLARGCVRLATLICHSCVGRRIIDERA
jgi:hypothetical protein